MRDVGLSCHGEHGSTAHGSVRDIEREVLERSQIGHRIAYAVDVQRIARIRFLAAAVEAGLCQVAAVEVDGVAAG